MSYRIIVILSFFFAVADLLTCCCASASVSIIEVVDADLDMAKQLQAYESIVEAETGTALVEYGPRLVAGEGDNADNYTIVRVLNKFQICELQFLAYPTSVRGGVAVSSGRLFSDETVITVCPISDTSTRQVRVFSQSGILLNSFEPESSLQEPFVISVGNFIADNDYEEIAIASKVQTDTSRDIFIYNGQGQLLTTITEPLAYSDAIDTLVLSTFHGNTYDELLLYYQVEKKAIRIDVAGSSMLEYKLDALPEQSGVYESAFDDQLFSAGAPEPTFSTLHIVDNQGIASSTDAGRRENRFWIQTYGDATEWEDSQYVKHGKFRHIRPDYQSDNYYPSPDFSSDVYTDWAGTRINNYINSCFSSYYTAEPSMWEPTFSHRHSPTVAAAWYNVIDTETGFRKYMMLDRNNAPMMCEGNAFYAFTYATDLPAIDRLYLWPQRAFLRELALYLRGEGGNAEQMVGVEPSHEMEIPEGPNGSIGDYNTKMISGFYNHLRKYHTTVSRINTVFGTSFTGIDDFDAPRNFGRGSWDAYDTNNKFFNAWIEYNRKIIFYRIAQGFREALIAGIPPEAIKTHQIPQGYAVGQPISSRRITPIDWIFTAGTGFGGTHYGVWYTNPINWLQAATSSGQTMISAGEYSPESNNQTYANEQLKYMFDNGVNFVHYMPHIDTSVIRDSCVYLQDDSPRLGTTGGIGQVRAVAQPSSTGVKRYNIVCIGTGDNRNGLLKSVNAYGNWEGTVYVSPFHSKVNVTPIGVEERDFNLTTADFVAGSITGLNSGDQIEMTFKARTDNSNGYLTLLILHRGNEMSQMRRHITVDGNWKYYRYTLRFQSVMDYIHLLMNSGIRDTSTGHKQNIVIEDFSLLVHREQVARKSYDILSGTPHSGGVTFDLLSDNYTCGLNLVQGDLNSDCEVNILDFSILADNWLK